MTDDLTRPSASFGDAASAPAAGAPMTRREARAAEGHVSRRALREAERAAEARAAGVARSAPDAPPVAATLPPLAPTPLAPAPAVPVASAVALAPAVPMRTRVARKVFPPVVMAAAAALIIGTSVPSNVLGDLTADAANASIGAVATASALDAGAVIETNDTAPSLAEGAAPAEAPPSQVLATEAADAEVVPVANRDDWSVTSYAELMRLQYGNRSFMYATTGTGAVRWPFPFAAEISSGFGNRSAPCRGCSSYHQGLDFVPGYGTPIQSIADGTVTFAGWGGGYGLHVIIDHVINGKKVTTLYAHMAPDSTPLSTGDPIAAGDYIGQVGDTGLSTAPHLHFELKLDGVAVDPYAWLTTNAS
ncbi:MAG TPA: M23 family metallopeptidase [Microcella sp.]|nr:M23 family metallopeptidase [Microcella sp.]